MVMRLGTFGVALALIPFSAACNRTFNGSNPQGIVGESSEPDPAERNWLREMGYVPAVLSQEIVESLNGVAERANPGSYLAPNCFALKNVGDDASSGNALYWFNGGDCKAIVGWYNSEEVALRAIRTASEAIAQELKWQRDGVGNLKLVLGAVEVGKASYDGKVWLVNALCTAEFDAACNLRVFRRKNAHGYSDVKSVFEIVLR